MVSSANVSSTILLWLGATGHGVAMDRLILWSSLCLFECYVEDSESDTDNPTVRALKLSDDGFLV